jgi:ubiquinone/menaquinone biosynthesis C-methylase UbiE
MKAFESVPGRYDLGMRLITLGHIDGLRLAIAEAIPAHSKVLDIGCGPGALLPLLASRDAQVTAIDKDPEMVSIARKRAAQENILDAVSINRGTAMEIDRSFGDGEFDAVVLSLVMSEMTIDERDWLVTQCARVLKPNGRLMIADEFQPSSTLKRVVFSVVRFPLHLIAYLYTQIKALAAPTIWWKIYYVVVELPLMLLSFFSGEPLTRPLKTAELNLPNNLRIVQHKIVGGGAIRLLQIQKEDSAE